MKITCANPECIKTINTLAVKLRLPGCGEKKDDQWFCSHKCYSSVLADRIIEDRRCGFKKALPSVELGRLLVKNNFINQEQLTLALQQKLGSNKKLGEILVEAGYITGQELKAVLAMQAGMALIVLDPRLKVKLKDDIPFKLISEFPFVIFDCDIESRVILIALYDVDYLSYLEEYFSKVYPGYLIKFYLEDKEKILEILTNNYPGKPLQVGIEEALLSKEESIKITALEKTVVKFMEFLKGLCRSKIKIDNLENAVWLKGETRDYKIDVYLTRKV
ncbi:MAG: hypothetical protein JSV88_30415 [Candidatus Aminicenantes bacterium]|nr:MAG: hypothetical protein JSV88_30415 [Candidatus Aminicenantes bacterium]